jgi:hypothetical protein
MPFSLFRKEWPALQSPAMIALPIERTQKNAHP